MKKGEFVRINPLMLQQMLSLDMFVFVKKRF